MNPFLHPVALLQMLGFGGGLVALAGVVVSGVAYTGASGERFSPLNHFISELGEVGVSRLAWFFNITLVLAGLLLAPSCVFLGLLVPGWLAKLAMAAGVGAAVSLSMVGVFPMNNLVPHVRAAKTFFRLGLAMAVLFTIAIAVQPASQPVIPRTAALASVPAILAYGAFLAYGGVAFRRMEDGAMEVMFTHRPRFWPLAALEWTIFVTTTFWFAAVALGI
jgi:hypothetical membrane protein